MTAPHRVGFVVFDGLTLLDVSGPADVLARSDRFGGGAYEQVLISAVPGSSTVLATGLQLGGAVPVDEAGHLDTLVVPGGDRLPGGPLEEPLLDATRRLAARAGRVASICTGAFVLAALGLLDGRRATTHWRHAATLARRHPAVRVEPDAIFVRDGDLITSAGVSSGIDLALALVEQDHGADVARSIARELVVFLQRPGGQSQFSTATSTPPPRSSPLRTVLDAVAAAPAEEHTLPSMAATAALSPRHLTRLFNLELGTTPARWVERSRLEVAQRLLLAGSTVTAAAERSGLGSDETLRRAFARHLGVTPTEYQRRFAATDVPAAAH